MIHTLPKLLMLVLESCIGHYRAKNSSDKSTVIKERIIFV